MKRRTPLRYVRITASPRPARECASTLRPKAIDVSAIARAIVRALLLAR